MEKDEEVIVFEDQDDYIEDIREQYREATRRYVLYCKMFGYPCDWKMMKDELKRFMHYELESAFSHTIIRETSDGIIMMKFDDPEELN